MAKVSVYVPDSRLPELERWRDKINFSQVFVEAFQEAVRKQESSEMTGDEIDSLIARLKQEQDEDFLAGKEGAFENGAEWAKHDASLRDLRRLCDPPQDFASMEVDEFFEILDPDEVRLNVAGRKYNIKECCEGGGYDWQTYTAGYMQGFVEGASSIWEQVHNRI